MKRFSVIILALAMLSGCAHKSQPLPVGANGAADATTYRVLADAQAFLGSIRQSVADGKLKLTQSQHDAFNALATAYNVAEAEWQTCHAGACSTQAQDKLSTDVGTLNSQLAAAQSKIGGAK